MARASLDVNHAGSEDLWPAVTQAFEQAGQRLLDAAVEAQEMAEEALVAEGAIVSDVDTEKFRQPLADLYKRVAKAAGAEDLLSAIRDIE